MEHSRRSIIDHYDSLVSLGRIERDSKQMAVVQKLDALSVTLVESRLASKSSALGWLFGARKVETPTPRGLYIWGSVGRGKTMLMDLFFDSVEIPLKRRVHFHAFMADVHKRIFAWRQKKKANEVKGDDPIAPIADELIKESTLLCFDEFAVTDIADAMILGRLFQALWARKIVVVATSNVDPGRSLQGRPEPRPVPALHRHDQEQYGGGQAGFAHRFPAGKARRRAGLLTRRPTNPRARPSTRPFARWRASSRGAAGSRCPCSGAKSPFPRPPAMSRASIMRICASSRSAPPISSAIAETFPRARRGQYSGHPARGAQRGETVHQSDRRALRPEGQADRLRRSGAGTALPRRAGPRGL